MPLVCVDVVHSCFVVAGEQKRDQKSSFFMTPFTHRAYECTMYSSRVVVMDNVLSMVVVHRTKVQYSAPTRLASVCSDVTGKIVARKFCRGDNNLVS